MQPPRVAVFFGTRPEAIKLAPVIERLRADSSLEVLTVSTGQHREMLDQVVRIFDLSVDHDLDVMQPGQSLAGLSSRLLVAIDELIQSTAPDFALVQGDTTTVLMAALACFYRGVPVGHVEAGLRTGNLASPFPEEANRVLATTLARLHFAPTMTSRDHLLREHVSSDRIFVTGNTVIDALQSEVHRQARADLQRDIAERLASQWPGYSSTRRCVLVTGHRRENFGEGFESICRAIAELADRFVEVDFVYPVHLNPRVQSPVRSLLSDRENVWLIEPQSYRYFVALMLRCTLVLTDSGGVQEESPALGKPVLVMRETTERPEGVESGTVRLVGCDQSSIVAAVTELLTAPKAYEAMAQAINPYGDGKASERIVRHVQDFLLKPIGSK